MRHPPAGTPRLLLRAPDRPPTNRASSGRCRRCPPPPKLRSPRLWTRWRRCSTTSRLSLAPTRPRARLLRPNSWHPPLRLPRLPPHRRQPLKPRPRRQPLPRRPRPQWLPLRCPRRLCLSLCLRQNAGSRRGSLKCHTRATVKTPKLRLHRPRLSPFRPLSPSNLPLHRPPRPRWSRFRPHRPRKPRKCPKPLWLSPSQHRWFQFRFRRL